MTQANRNELRHEIHLAMLAKSQNATEIGELTVVPLGFAVSIAEALITQKVIEGRIDELKVTKKLATQHCAFKIDQYGSDLDTEDVRLAVPNRKIDDRIVTLQSKLTNKDTE